jgi:hypothetical protein
MKIAMKYKAQTTKGSQEKKYQKGKERINNLHECPNDTGEANDVAPC